MFNWITTQFKEHPFEAILTIFTIFYATSFALTSYWTERAYVVFGRSDGVVVELLKGNQGFDIFYTNAGRTPAEDVVTEVIVTKEKQVAVIGEREMSINHRLLPAGYPEDMRTGVPGGAEEIEKIKRGEDSVGIAGRIYYTDVFRFVHCVEFSGGYHGEPVDRFEIAGVIGLCDPIVKSIRYNRVCVPTADRKNGVWVATWEAFSVEKPDSESPVNDPAPCLAKPTPVAIATPANGKEHGNKNKK